MKNFKTQACALIAIYLTLPPGVMAQAAPPPQSYAQGKALCDSAAAFAVADGKAIGMRCVAHPWSKTIVVTIEDESRSNPSAYRAPAWGTVKAMAANRRTGIGAGWAALVQSGPGECQSFDSNSIDKLSTFDGPALTSPPFYEAASKYAKSAPCRAPVEQASVASGSKGSLCSKVESGAQIDGGLIKSKTKCQEFNGAVQLISSPLLDMSFNSRPAYYALAAVSRSGFASWGNDGRLLLAPFSSNPTECIAFEKKDLTAIAERVVRDGAVDKFAPLAQPILAMNSQAASSILGGMLDKLKQRRAVPCIGFSEIEPVYITTVKGRRSLKQ